MSSIFARFPKGWPKNVRPHQNCAWAFFLFTFIVASTLTSNTLFRNIIPQNQPSFLKKKQALRRFSMKHPRVPQREGLFFCGPHVILHTHFYWGNL